MVRARGKAPVIKRVTILLLYHLCYSTVKYNTLLNHFNVIESAPKYFLILNVCFISLELHGRRNSSLTKGFLGAI